MPREKPFYRHVPGIGTVIVNAEEGLVIVTEKETRDRFVRPEVIGFGREKRRGDAWHRQAAGIAASERIPVRKQLPLPIRKRLQKFSRLCGGMIIAWLRPDVLTLSLANDHPDFPSREGFGEWVVENL